VKISYYVQKNEYIGMNLTINVTGLALRQDFSKILDHFIGSFRFTFLITQSYIKINYQAICNKNHTQSYFIVVS